VTSTSSRSGSSTPAPGEQQQLVGGAAEALQLGCHRLQHPAGVLRVDAAPQRHLDLGAHQRQRRTELVGGVGGEPLEAAEGGLEAGEHAVQGRGQVTELVGGEVELDAAVEVVLAEVLRGLGHDPHRPQDPSRQPVPGDRGDAHQGGHGDHQEEDGAGHGVLELDQRAHQDEGGGAAVVDGDPGGQHPLPLAVDGAEVQQLPGAVHLADDRRQRAGGRRLAGVVEQPAALVEQDGADADAHRVLVGQEVAVGEGLGGRVPGDRGGDVALLGLEAGVDGAQLGAREGHPEDDRPRAGDQREDPGVGCGQPDSGAAEETADSRCGSKR
jgi:hypothetical protein